MTDVPHQAQSEPGMDVKMTAVGEPRGLLSREERACLPLLNQDPEVGIILALDDALRAALDRAEKAEKQKEWANAELVRERSKRMVEAANLEQERDQLAAQNAELRGALKAAINEAEEMKDAGFGVGARDSWLAALSLTPQAALAEVEARVMERAAGMATGGSDDVTAFADALRSEAARIREGNHDDALDALCYAMGVGAGGKEPKDFGTNGMWGREE